MTTVTTERPFQFSLKLLFSAVTFIAVVLSGWQGFKMWNKSRFCQRRAANYMLCANESRQMASDPAVSDDDAAGYRLHAKHMEMIAAKYQAIADHPWRPYLHAPLLTREDEVRAVNEVRAEELQAEHDGPRQ